MPSTRLIDEFKVKPKNPKTFSLCGYWLGSSATPNASKHSIAFSISLLDLSSSASVKGL